MSERKAQLEGLCVGCRWFSGHAEEMHGDCHRYPHAVAIPYADAHGCGEFARRWTQGANYVRPLHEELQHGVLVRRPHRTWTDTGGVEL